jgi:integral membrane protein
MDLLNSSVGRLRVLGFIEGVSMVVLLFIAMPLKYMAGKPEMVSLVGSIHGGLFVLLCLYALYVGYEKGWNFWKTTVWILVGSIFPFGPFIVDHKLLKDKA